MKSPPLRLFPGRRMGKPPQNNRKNNQQETYNYAYRFHNEPYTGPLRRCKADFYWPNRVSMR
jgi:hypothetical protein